MTASPCYILGISSGYHDAAVALVRDGVVVAAIAEERLSHIKHDASFPHAAVGWCLGQAGIAAHELAGVVYYEQPATKFLRILVSALSTFPRGFRFFADAMQRWLPQQLWVNTTICQALCIAPERVSRASHHMSHAAHAFFNSPFERAAILTVDAVGEWSCTSIAIGDRQAATPVHIIEEQVFPSSIGLFYAAMTAFLGFQPNSDECSTMALAAYGKPVFQEPLLALLGYDPAHPGRLDLSVMDIHTFLPAGFHQRLRTLLGPPRDMRTPLPFDVCAGDGAVDAASQRYADIAASVQAVLEVLVLDLARHALARSGQTSLCLAGGVANNCVLVGKLVAQWGKEAVYVPLDPGDAGSAVGAAQVGYWRMARQLPVPMPGAYTGMAPAVDGLAELLAVLAARQHPDTGGLAWHAYTAEADLLAAVAQHLNRGQLVGWVQGPCEFGPRALGARSILAHPANPGAVHRLGREVKPRAAFRPYGVSMTEALARQAFGWEEGIPYPARWMQMAATVKEACREPLRSCLAVDGTTRPQVCRAADLPRFVALLEAVGHQTGTPALLNTSFNIPGYPMVATAMDALAAFLHMGLDVLVIDNILITREDC